jgi:flagellar biosynthetic protein FliR
MDGTVLWVSHFALLLVRNIAVFTISPVLGRQNVPMYTKIMLSVMLTFILLPLHPPPDEMIWGSIFHYTYAILSEAAVGLIIGYMNTLFFALVFTAGQVIDMKIGFGMVKVFDVQSNVQVPVAGSLLNMVVLLCFLISDGHIKLIHTLSRTYEIIPLGQVTLNVGLVYVVIETFIRTFVIAVNIALPVLAAGLLAEAALGIIVRITPQMNVFVVGMPLKVLLGLFMLFLIMPIFVMLTGSIFEQMFDAIGYAFNALAENTTDIIYYPVEGGGNYVSR